MFGILSSTIRVATLSDNNGKSDRVALKALPATPGDVVASLKAHGCAKS